MFKSRTPCSALTDALTNATRNRLEGFVALIELLLEHGAAIQPKAVEHATKHDDLDLLRMFVSRGAVPVSSVLKFVKSAAAATILVEAGAPVTIDALSSAVDHPEVFAVFLNKWTGPKELLVSLFDRCTDDTVRILIDFGVVPRATTDITWGTAKKLQLMLGAGAKPGKNDLIDAVSSTVESTQKLKILLDAGVRDRMGDALWDCNQHVENTKLLLAAGADPSLMRNGVSLLHGVRDTRMVHMLVDAGLNVDVRDYQGCTPLHYAANASQQTALVQAIVARGANVNAVAKHGHPPLVNPVNGNDLSTTELLLKSGANPNVPLGGVGVLNYSCSYEMVKLLLKYGAAPLPGLASAFCEAIRIGPMRAVLEHLGFPRPPPFERIKTTDTLLVLLDMGYYDSYKHCHLSKAALHIVNKWSLHTHPLQIERKAKTMAAFDAYLGIHAPAVVNLAGSYTNSAPVEPVVGKRKAVRAEPEKKNKKRRT